MVNSPWRHATESLARAGYAPATLRSLFDAPLEVLQAASNAVEEDLAAGGAVAAYAAALEMHVEPDPPDGNFFDSPAPTRFLPVVLELLLLRRIVADGATLDARFWAFGLGENSARTVLPTAELCVSELTGRSLRFAPDIAEGLGAEHTDWETEYHEENVSVWPPADHVSVRYAAAVGDWMIAIPRWMFLRHRWVICGGGGSSSQIMPMRSAKSTR